MAQVADSRGAAGPDHASTAGIEVVIPRHLETSAVLVWADDQIAQGDGAPQSPSVERFAQLIGTVVVRVAYRLGPQHTFPAAVDDVFRATASAIEIASRHGARCDRVAVGGAGIGGGLAAATTLLARAYCGPDLCAQILAAPLLDARLASPSWFANARAGDERLRIDGLLESYAPGLTRTDRLLSPLCESSHKGLPPAAIVTGEWDPMRDDGERYAQVLSEAGVPVVGHRYPAIGHRDAAAGSPDVVAGLARAVRLLLR